MNDKFTLKSLSSKINAPKQIDLSDPLVFAQLYNFTNAKQHANFRMNLTYTDKNEKVKQVCYFGVPEEKGNFTKDNYLYAKSNDSKGLAWEKFGEELSQYTPEQIRLIAGTALRLMRVLKPDDQTIDNYVLIQPGASDITKVLTAYFHHPVPAYNIASIEIVYNEQLNRVFFGNMKMMNARKGNKKYMPAWQTAGSSAEQQWRASIHAQLAQLSKGHEDPRVPNMRILPMWHGTQDKVASHIFNTGYGIFNDPNFVTDEGYFGKGIYAAHEAEYSFRSYAKKHGSKAVLLLNWVSSFEAYPVIDGDMPNLQGKTVGYDNCDAHFIPVRSDHHPHTNVYYPCAPAQQHHYTEMVVFNPAQCLPRYRIKLLASLPQPGIEEAAVLAYQMALDFLGLYQYERVANAWEDAHDTGHPAAAIRLHWLYSGASGVIPADSDQLHTCPTPTSDSLSDLKRKAHFRGDNDPEAQFNLAWCYQHALGVEINLAKAAQYYWIAATQGHREAQYHLGLCCSAGIGVKQEMGKAIFYYEKAAANGHIHAHYLLSHCYEFSLGVPANAAKALTHKQAAQKGKHPQLAGLLPIVPVVNTEDKKTIARLEQALAQKETEFNQQLTQHQEINNQLTQAVSIETQKLQQKEKELRHQQQQAINLSQSLSQQANELKAKEAELQQQKGSSAQDQQKITALTQALSAEKQALQNQVEQLQHLTNELQRQQQSVNNLTQMLEIKERSLQESAARESSLKQELQTLKKKEAAQPPQALGALGFFPAPVSVQPPIPQAVVRDEANLKLLLKWVVEGHLEEAEKLLKLKPELSLMAGEVTDLSGRTFRGITGLQYAYWALDGEMMDVMIKFMDKQAAWQQLDTFARNPQQYSVNGLHYDNSELLRKMNHYIQNWSQWSREQCANYWQKEIGGEQRKCPAWIVYGMCEEGKDAMWTRKDVNKRVARQYGKAHISWLFKKEYNGGKCGESWGAARGGTGVCWYGALVGGDSRRVYGRERGPIECTLLVHDHDVHGLVVERAKPDVETRKTALVGEPTRVPGK